MSLEDLVRLATVRIELPDRSGTGFLIAPDVVMTCAHVVADRASTPPQAVVGRLVADGRKLHLQPEKAAEVDDTDIAILHVVDGGALPQSMPLCPAVEIGDPLWTFGHPTKQGRYDFSDGQPLLLTYQGESLVSGDRSHRRSGRVSGAVPSGFSGAPVVNLRTGGVCGMLYISNQTNSAHLVATADLLAQSSDVQAFQSDTAGFRSWLDVLEDGQISAGNWRHAGPTIRAYLKGAVKAAQDHPYLGVQATGNVPELSQVYLRQQVVPHRERANREPTRAEANVEPFPAEQLLALRENCIVLGESGSGKSSLLRMGVTQAARPWLEGRSGESIPIRVLAADLAREVSLSEAMALGANADLRAAGFTADLPSSLFAGAPVPGSTWLVLVDALDEILRPEIRRSVMRKISEVRRNDPASPYRFVVATRPLPAEELPHYPQWAERPFELMPFGLDELPTFVQGWLSHLGLRDPGSETVNFMREIDRAQLTELALIPLVATMLCQLYARDPAAPLPPGRTEIYAHYLDLIMGARLYNDESGGVRPQLLAVLEPYGAAGAADSLLERAPALVGRLAAARLTGAGGTAVTLLSAFTSADRPGNVPPSAWNQVLTELLRRSGLFRERQGDLEFLHQSILEYLAARYTAADASASQSEFNSLLDHWKRSWLSRRWVLPSEGKSKSYYGFLLGEWISGTSNEAPSSPMLHTALLRLAEHGGDDGHEFLVSVVLDRTDLPAAVVDALRVSLIGLASARRSWPEWLGIIVSNVSFVESAAEGQTESRFVSILLLRHLGDPAVPGLLSAFLDDPWVNQASAYAMGVSLKEEDVDLRISAFTATIDRSTVSGNANKYVRSSDQMFRESAARELVKLGHARGVDFLLAKANDESDDSRFSAAKTLAELGQAAGLDVLLAAADDPVATPDQLQEIGAALIELGHPWGTHLLETRMATGDQRSRLAAAGVLIKQGNLQAHEVLDEAVTAFEASKNELRTQHNESTNWAAIQRQGAEFRLQGVLIDATKAATALAAAGRSAGFDALFDIARTPEAWGSERVAAAETLAELGDPRGLDQLASFASDRLRCLSLPREGEVLAWSSITEAVDQLREHDDPRAVSLNRARRRRLRWRIRRRLVAARRTLFADVVQAVPVIAVGILFGLAWTRSGRRPSGWGEWIAASVSSLIVLYLLTKLRDWLARPLRQWKIRVRWGGGLGTFSVVVMLSIAVLAGIRLGEHSRILSVSDAHTLWRLFLWHRS